MRDRDVAVSSFQGPLMLFALVSSLAVLAVPVAGTHGVDSNAFHVFMVAEDASYAPRFFRAPLAQKISFTGVGSPRARTNFYLLLPLY